MNGARTFGSGSKTAAVDMTARAIADIRDGEAAGAWRRRHTPAHHNHFALGSFVTHDRRRIVRTLEESCFPP
jgi:hypothetical protein